jgi:hypothetical protein
MRNYEISPDNQMLISNQADSPPTWTTEDAHRREDLISRSDHRFGRYDPKFIDHARARNKTQL